MTSAPPSDNLFITDLPAEIVEASITQIFGAYGTIVSCRHLPPRAPGQKSCALIRFAQVSEAQWLVDNLHGNIPEGLVEPVQVKFAREPAQQHQQPQTEDQPPPPKTAPPPSTQLLALAQPPPQQGGGKGGSGGDDSLGGGGGGCGGGGDWSSGGGDWGGAPGVPSDNLYLTGLPADTDNGLIYRIFGPYGTVLSCRVMPPRLPGQSAAALIRFSTLAEAKWLVDNLNGNIPAGLTDPVTVRFAQNKSYPQGQQDAGWGKAANEGRSKARAQEWGYTPYESKGSGASKGKGQGKADGKGCQIRVLLNGIMNSGIYPGSYQLPDSHCAYVKGLPSDTTDIDLYRMFAPFGAIAPRGVKAHMREDGYGCSGIGFVDFVDPADCLKAIAALSGTTMPDGSKMLVFVKNSTRKGDGGKDGFKGGKGVIMDKPLAGAWEPSSA